jgi:hypothetical protein
MPVTQRALMKSNIRVIRFTERIASQCASGGDSGPDRVVCDTIATGSRKPTGRTGRFGGPIVIFEKAFRRVGQEGGGARVAVVGEVTRRCCFALAIPPGYRPEKIWAELGFLNRSGSK